MQLQKCAPLALAVAISVAPVYLPVYLPARSAFAEDAARLGRPAPATTPAAVAPAKRAQKVAAPAVPAAAQFKSVDGIARWINGYRERPEPKRLPALVHAMGELQMFADQETSGLYLGFVGGVLAANPSMTKELVAKMFPLPPEYQAALIKAIAYSGLDGWRELLRANAERMPSRVALIDRFTSGKMPALDALQLDAGPIPLDVLWGNYFATGSYEPIVRIVSVLKWSQDTNDVEKLTVGSMAKWTLAVNASRDAELVRLLKWNIAHEPRATVVLLNEVIEAAETGETMKIRKGAVSAIEQLKAKGPSNTRSAAWWGQAGQMALSLGCVAASALGAAATIGIPCVIGGAASTAALKMLTPQQ